MNRVIPAHSGFPWPKGVRAGVSITFDDSRPSQLDVGIPTLQAHSLRGTFYVVPEAFEPRLDDWKAAIAEGHEIGNHTVTHPCSGNFRFSRWKALEEYTLEKIADDIDRAQHIIQDRLQVTPSSFAYPCGHDVVGRGVNVQSYVPVVAQRFPFARGFRHRHANDPSYVDLNRLLGFDFDQMTPETLAVQLDAAIATGDWIVLAGHDVGHSDEHQTVQVETLAYLGRRAADPDQGLWVDTVSAIGQYVLQQREAAGATASASATPRI